MCEGEGRKELASNALGKGEGTHVRPVERLMPARTALMRMASKPRCMSFPSIFGLHTTDGRAIEDVTKESLAESQCAARRPTVI